MEINNKKRSYWDTQKEFEDVSLMNFLGNIDPYEEVNIVWEFDQSEVISGLVFEIVENADLDLTDYCVCWCTVRSGKIRISIEEW